jgi:hypothetical protein
MTMQIGSYIVTQPTTFDGVGGGQVVVAPGTYPVTGSLNIDGSVVDLWVIAKMPATEVGSERAVPHAIAMRGADLARQLLDGTSPVTLAGGFEAIGVGPIVTHNQGTPQEATFQRARIVRKAHTLV